MSPTNGAAFTAVAANDGTEGAQFVANASGKFAGGATVVKQEGQLILFYNRGFATR